MVYSNTLPRFNCFFVDQLVLCRQFWLNETGYAGVRSPMTARRSKVREDGVGAVSETLV